MFVNRRALLTASAAAGAAWLAGAKAHAKFTGDVQLRGAVGRLERLPTRELESLEDFSTAVRAFVDGDLNRAAERRAAEVFKAARLSSTDEVPVGQIVHLLETDPVVMSLTHTWINGQLLMWQRLQHAFHADADRYLAEMEAADMAGPGTLELNPTMDIPAYTRWEIHNQPGGYVGDPFAGHMYHYGTNNLYLHRNDQDAQHIRTAGLVPTPADGAVRRILDLGCSCGQLTVALKERFPEAEVWGIDIGAPMVRYAHMRAVDLGVGANFAQRLAEDNKFPDGHFDIVVANILFHEVTIDAAHAILRESMRALRPGGLFYPIERSFMVPRPRATAGFRFRNWWNDRWNHEVHFLPYSTYDYAAAMADAGFAVRTDAPSSAGSKGNLLGVRPA
ncbi:MAG: class I SAM-dependent methyltransferase [Rhodospirillaceae bacterium]|nr:class I SAM-dependent methyltransferase [Rhodospirillaceae bacterium]